MQAAQALLHAPVQRFNFDGLKITRQKVGQQMPCTRCCVNTTPQLFHKLSLLKESDSIAQEISFLGYQLRQGTGI